MVGAGSAGGLEGTCSALAARLAGTRAHALSSAALPARLWPGTPHVVLRTPHPLPFPGW